MSSKINYLIMDIGGGSVEIILANDVELIWAKSFNIGVLILKSNFHTTEPIKHD